MRYKLCTAYQCCDVVVGRRAFQIRVRNVGSRLASTPFTQWLNASYRIVRPVSQTHPDAINSISTHSLKSPHTHTHTHTHTHSLSLQFLSLARHPHSTLCLTMAAATASLTVSRLLSSPKPTISLLSPKALPSALSSSSSLLSLRLRQRQPSLRFSATTAATKISAAISVGDKLPESTFSYFDAADELQTVTVLDLTKSKKAILFAVPGAFTPTCSQKHLPGFVVKAAELKSKGVDTIACISVNDAFVMKAWKKDLNVGDELLLLSDGNGDFTRAIGCELDLSDKPVGLGVRSRRYALLAEDGVVKVLNLEEGGSFTFSGAEDMLKVL